MGAGVGVQPWCPLSLTRGQSGKAWTSGPQGRELPIRMPRTWRAVGHFRNTHQMDAELGSPDGVAWGHFPDRALAQPVTSSLTLQPYSGPSLGAAICPPPPPSSLEGGWRGEGCAHSAPASSVPGTVTRSAPGDTAGWPTGSHHVGLILGSGLGGQGRGRLAGERKPASPWERWWGPWTCQGTGPAGSRGIGGPRTPSAAQPGEVRLDGLSPVGDRMPEHFPPHSLRQLSLPVGAPGGTLERGVQLAPRVICSVLPPLGR